MRAWLRRRVMRAYGLLVIIPVYVLGGCRHWPDRQPYLAIVAVERRLLRWAYP